MRSREQQMPLFWLSLAGFYRRGSCWLLLAGMVVFVWLVPLLTLWQEQPQILQPARSQAAWMYVWLSLFTWIPFQSAALGQRLRTQGLLEFLHARGARVCGLYLQVGLSVVLWFLCLVSMACLFCILFCSPKDPLEAASWLTLVAEYGALLAVVGVPLCALGVALGTRVGEVIGYLLPVCLLFCGLIAASWLGPILVGSESPVVRGAWLLLPHYHLADLTPRLVFKMGALSPSGFRDSAVCLSLQGAALILLGRCLIRIRS